MKLSHLKKKQICSVCALIAFEQKNISQVPSHDVVGVTASEDPPAVPEPAGFTKVWALHEMAIFEWWFMMIIWKELKSIRSVCSSKSIRSISKQKGWYALKKRFGLTILIHVDLQAWRMKYLRIQSIQRLQRSGARSCGQQIPSHVGTGIFFSFWPDGWKMLLQKVAEDDCDEVDFEDSEAVLFSYCLLLSFVLVHRYDIGLVACKPPGNNQHWVLGHHSQRWTVCSQMA